MSTPMPAAVLEVVHHDDSRTEYRDVTYWPWPNGVSVWRPDGGQIDHDDVLHVLTPAAAG